MTIAIHSIVRRSPLHGVVEALSAATLERVETADGRTFVLKHLPESGDWLTRASGRRDSVRQLWTSGVLDRINAVVDHTIVDVVDDHGHDVVVMRDVSAHLLPTEGTILRATSRRLLAGLAALHELGRHETPQQLCPLGARYQMFAPHIHEADNGPGSHPRRQFIVSGWALFAEHAPADIVDAVFAVHRDPTSLADRLAHHPTTLLHGDTKIPNLGLGPHGLIAIDWGDLTGFGPPEVDVAWYALMNEQNLGTTPDEIFADYQAVAARPLEPEALDLACIGSLAQMGFKLPSPALHGSTPNILHGADNRLTWWCRRVDLALERTGLA
jgi:hypothetical protein